MGPRRPPALLVYLRSSWNLVLLWSHMRPPRQPHMPPWATCATWVGAVAAMIVAAMIVVAMAAAVPAATVLGVLLRSVRHPRTVKEPPHDSPLKRVHRSTA